jgi:peptidoglycan/LPS O-acetylase OafA/YrhL
MSEATGGSVDRRLLSLDALRGLGALSILTFHSVVVTQHLSHGVDTLHQTLDFGLLIFFVVSGAIMGGPFVRSVVDGRRLPNIRNFAIRRAARVFPVYLVALPTVFLIVGHVPLWHLLVHAVLMQNVVPGLKNELLTVSWTLHIEIIYYALLAIAGVWIWRTRRVPVSPERLVAWIGAAWAFSILWFVATDALITHATDLAVVLKFCFPAQMGYICPGLLVAVLATDTVRTHDGVFWRMQRAITEWRTGVPIVAALVLLGMAMIAVEGPATSRSVTLLHDLHREPFAAGAAVLVALGLAYEKRLRPVTRLVAPLGVITYSFYLWQIVVLDVLTRLHVYPVSAGLLSWPLSFAFFFAATCVVATISYTLVERPALRWSLSRGIHRVAGSEHSPVHPEVSDVPSATLAGEKEGAVGPLRLGAVELDGARQPVVE